MKGFVKRMSAREVALGVVVLAALASAVAALVVLLAFRSLEAMDEDIARLEDELLTYSQRVKEGENVNRAFEQIAREHSSAWTQVEIHDRLRKEIGRLSLQALPPPGTDVVTGGQASGPHLVDILTLADGQLTESGKGYREYQIAFDVQPTVFSNVVMFLRRLQESPQALRIQALDLKRQPDSTAVSAHVTVTRIVVDTGSGPGVPGGSSLGDVALSSVRNGSFEQWDAEKKAFPEWRSQDCLVGQARELAVDGQACLRAEASGAAAAVYQELSLPGGETYEVSLALLTKGSAMLGVEDLGANVSFAGGRTIDTKGQPMACRVRFTVPGKAGELARVGVPFVRVAEGGALFLDAVVMRGVGN